MQFGTPRTTARTPRRLTDLGATLVEYALGVSLLCVASLGAIGVIQSSLEDNIEEHGASAGAPDLPDLGISTTTATTSSPTTAPPATSPPATVTASGNILATRVGIDSGNKWDPAVDLSALNSATGETLRDVTIAITWTYDVGGTPTTVTPTPCSAPSTGTCSFQLNDLRSNNGANCTPSVTFTVTSITSSSQTIVYAAGSTTGTITGPSPCT